ncbi:DUF3168 domain-containing protein [Frigidibacter oleivorans]|uniref:DUF3168 domain-containing protein n=1 Tax=Frigidibacter oleivorans TaxID=2487129 RepID=UPI000F8CFADE|nr:DUF3168 domain-containing protein [Frigidibacter oleivorans]
MMEASLDLQRAIRARLIAAPALTAAVPAGHILDRNAGPELFPCILIGEGQALAGDGLMRTRHEIFLDLHVWADEPGLATAKLICGLIRDTLRDGPWALEAHHVADAYFQATRFMRDPDGRHSHAVITLRAHLVEAA